MLTYPDINPVALSLGPFQIPLLGDIGPLQVHWYGLMYVIGFAAAWLLGRWRASRPGSEWTGDMVDDLVFYGMIGTIAGGRIGYMLFYGTDQLLANPLSIIKLWEGGMSFHGGLIGVMIAMLVLARQYHLRFFQVGDFLAPLVPIGLLAGRIGNFINGELWGHRTDLPWGVRLPCADFPRQCADLPPGTQWSIPVHASQLYEAALEGLTLFLILWFFSRKPRPMMAVSGLFLLGYGCFRFLIEFVRVPDIQLGYLAFDWLTMGQLLSLPMILCGGLLIAFAYWRAARQSAGTPPAPATRD